MNIFSQVAAEYKLMLGWFWHSRFERGHRLRSIHGSVYCGEKQTSTFLSLNTFSELAQEHWQLPYPFQGIRCGGCRQPLVPEPPHPSGCSARDQQTNPDLKYSKNVIVIKESHKWGNNSHTCSAFCVLLNEALKLNIYKAAVLLLMEPARVKSDVICSVCQSHGPALPQSRSGSVNVFLGLNCCFLHRHNDLSLVSE